MKTTFVLFLALVVVYKRHVHFTIVFRSAETYPVFVCVCVCVYVYVYLFLCFFVNFVEKVKNEMYKINKCLLLNTFLLFICRKVS